MIDYCLNFASKEDALASCQGGGEPTFATGHAVDSGEPPGVVPGPSGGETFSVFFRNQTTVKAPSSATSVNVYSPGEWSPPHRGIEKDCV